MGSIFCAQRAQVRTEFTFPRVDLMQLSSFQMVVELQYTIGRATAIAPRDGATGKSTVTDRQFQIDLGFFIRRVEYAELWRL